MNTQEALNILSELQTKKQAELDAVNYCMNLLQSGYQSDQQAIADTVTKQVGDVRDDNGALLARISSLEADLADTTKANDDKDAQIVDLAAYKEAHPDIQIA